MSLEGLIREGPGVETAHAAVTHKSAEQAERIFGELFAMKLAKRFVADAELIEPLFGQRRSIEILVFEADGASIEVFVDPELEGLGTRFEHLCFVVPDRESLLVEARLLGLEVSRLATATKDVAFLRDADGNRYEIKEGPPRSQ